MSVVCSSMYKVSLCSREQESKNEISDTKGQLACPGSQLSVVPIDGG